MKVKVRFDVLEKRLKNGRHQKIIPREKPDADISVNELASRIATELFNEISEPFNQIYDFLESRGLMTVEIAEKISDEREKLWRKFESKEFDRKFLLKNVGREKGKLNSDTPKFSKSKLKQFIKTYFQTYHEIPKQTLAAKNLGFANDKALKRARTSFGDKNRWQTYCKNVLKNKD